MCGFAGVMSIKSGRKSESLRDVVSRMSETLVHRGPDDSGIWVDERGSAGVALGFRRLAIIDLTAEGHQPMLSASGRYAIAFNGEVYNFKELRAELDKSGLAPRFRGGSDTEVILAAIEAWGVEQAVKKFVGMFAFALWDRQERVMRLVRDRFGVKPLYYGRLNGDLVFASELKAIRAFDDFNAEIDRDSLALFMRHGCISSPYSIYKGIHKLPPGMILTIGMDSEAIADAKPYWSALDAAVDGISKPFRGTDSEAMDQLDSLLRDCIGLRMIADVPLGVFLSGGVDSSLVVAMMQAQTTQPVKTFTIGFEDEKFNEAGYALDVAKHLGTDHTHTMLTPKETLAVVPKLPALYDEPFADPSQIPTFLVSQLARTKVTVALSGDGGDEFFGGYNTYRLAASIWKNAGSAPFPMRRLMAGLLTSAASLTKEGSAGRVNRADKLRKLAAVVDSRDRVELFRRMMSFWHVTDDLVPGSQDAPIPYTNFNRRSLNGRFEEEMMYLDAVSYLPDDILVKVDRASMGVSLEAREPLLDHRLFEFAWRLPLGMKIRGGQGKWILRQVLQRYVPNELIDRPKKGFGVPIAEWLRGPLREWAEDLLSEERLRREGFLDASIVRNCWSEHLSRKREWPNRLWNVLMFQSWLKEGNR